MNDDVSLNADVSSNDVPLNDEASKNNSNETEEISTFDRGINMGCWRMIPIDGNLLIQKNVDGVWITKQLLS